jgi:hypothetical protein
VHADPVASALYLCISDISKFQYTAGPTWCNTTVVPWIRASIDITVASEIEESLEDATV